MSNITFHLVQQDFEPAPRHDGSLDEYGNGMVEISEYRVVISSQEQGPEAFAPVEAVHLTPEQALSLLVWLEHNREDLQRMTKEPDHG